MNYPEFQNTVSKLQAICKEFDSDLISIDYTFGKLTIQVTEAGFYYDISSDTNYKFSPLSCDKTYTRVSFDIYPNTEVFTLIKLDE